MLHVQWRRVAAGALAAGVVASLLGGCATATSGTPAASGTPVPRGTPVTGGTPVVAGDKSNGHTMSLKVGERLELILGSTYWRVAGSSVPGVLHQDGPPSLLKRPPGCGSIPGLGCVPIRTDFSAVAPGTAVVTASRASCGEAMRCLPSMQHFTLTVVVRGS